jgi:hypothetical protein
MARTKAQTIDRNFVAGLVTDTTALNFPENACTETLNCVFEPSGRVTRRLGFDWETDFATKSIALDNNVVTSFYWEEVAGNGNINYYVVQVGATLYFYDTVSGSVSFGALSDTVDLSTHAISGATELATQACQFAYGRGYLFVTHPQCDPFYVEWDGSDISSHTITVEIRDLIGVDDGLDIDQRPTATVGSMDDEHKYNLFNQGWYHNGNAALTAWDSARTDLPSNSDVWWEYKNTSDAFDANTIANTPLGNTPAPKGHYVLEAFNKDRSTVSGVSGIAVESVDNRPSVVAFFAGRVWYGGVDSQKTVNTLYFSQVVEDPSDFGQCYQANDPTSEELFALLPTDGGTLEVSGAGVIYKLVPMGNSLLVFASNGIWAVAGSEGIGFVANDFSVIKISSSEIDNDTSFVIVEGAPFWWGSGGIFTILTQDNLTFRVQSITDNKIREFYVNDIPPLSKTQAVGAYNPEDRTINWLYRSTESDTPETTTQFDRVLVYNILTQAFYLWEIPVENVRVHSIGLFKKSSEGITTLEVEVDNGDEVQLDDGTEVISFLLATNVSIPTFKYLVSYDDNGTDKFTFAETNNDNYLDWEIYDSSGTNYVSTFTTGYKVHTDGQRFFQSNYVHLFVDSLTEDDSLYMQGVFDFTSSGNSGKWSSKQGLNAGQQVYSPHKNVGYRKLKLRGKGKSLQLRFSSDSNKPFSLIGWGLWESANADI